MMPRYRPPAACVVAAVAAIALAGCGGDATAPPAAPSSPAPSAATSPPRPAAAASPPAVRGEGSPTRPGQPGGPPKRAPVEVTPERVRQILSEGFLEENRASRVGDLIARAFSADGDARARLAIAHLLTQEGIARSSEADRSGGEHVDEALEMARVIYRGLLDRRSVAIDAHVGLGRTFQFRAPEKALEHYRDALAIDPAHGEAAQGAAEALTHLRRYDEAEALLRDLLDSGALERPQDIGDAAEKLGRSLLLAGRHADAEKALREAEATLDPKNPDHLGNHGCLFQAFGALYLSSGRTEQAVEALRRSADFRRDDPDFQLLAAVSAFCNGDFHTARRYIDRSLALRQTLIARIFRDKIDAREAAEASGEAPKDKADRSLDAAMGMFAGVGPQFAKPFAEHAYALDPSPPARALLESMRLGERYEHRRGGADVADRAVSAYGPSTLENALELFDLGDFASARVVLSRCPAPARRSPDGLLLAGFLALLEQDFDGAKARFEALSAGGADDRVAAVAQAHLAMALQRYEEAAATLSALPAAAGDVDATRSDRAWVVRKLELLARAWSSAHGGRHDEAVGHFNAILAWRPFDLLALLGKANSLSAAGDNADALQVLDRVLERHPTNPYALSEVGMVRFALKDDAGAEAALKEAAARGGEGFSCPYEGLGLLYLRKGRTDEAQKHLKKAIAASPDTDFKKYDALARIHIEQGDFAKARKLLEKSLANYPANAEARRMLDEIADR